MKIYLSDINESWIVDRVRNDWYEHNMQISTKQIKDSDIFEYLKQNLAKEGIYILPDTFIFHKI